MLQRLFSHDNDPSVLQKVVKILNSGGIVIYPTDSVYALGCNALKSNAIERICKIKGVEPSKSHFSIICHNLSEISKYAKMDNQAFKLMKRNLPGPFTFILEASNNLPKIFRNRKTIGIRLSDNNIVNDILSYIGSPLITTSLPLINSDDSNYETDPELIYEKFGNKVDIVIDGGIGETIHSTIVDCTNGNMSIIRQGKGILYE